MNISNAPVSEPVEANPIMNNRRKLLTVTAAISLLIASLGTENSAPMPSGLGEEQHAAAALTPPAASDDIRSFTDAGDNAVALTLDAIPALSDGFSSSSTVRVASAEMGPPQFDDFQDDARQATPEKVLPRDKMSGPVAALYALGGAGDAEIVVRYDQYPELFDDERVAELGGEVTRSYAHLDMRAVRIPVAALEALASEDSIEWLSIDDEMSATSVASRDAANMPTTASAHAGYNGSNVGIAVLDTGVSKHGDLSEDILQYSFLNGAYPEPEVAAGQIVSYNDSARDDKFGHGTHVAALLSGSGDEAGDEYKGSATGSKVLALQVLDKDGAGSMSDVMAALDWLLTYGSYFDIRVVNLSLGKGISESNETDPLVIAVERLWDAGMVVVVAAGNEGFSGSMSITSPANSRKVITVGSLTDSATGTDHSDDYVSTFSSTGPTIGDYVLKPDLLAPGNRVVAAIPPNSKLAKALKTRLKSCKKNACSSSYLEMSGTSMATPIVSAAVALMLDKDPSLSPATVKARLMRSARKLDANPSDAGAGLLDAEAALSDAGTVTAQALSPMMIFDEATNSVLVEDTAILWGDAAWGSGYLYNNGFSWATGASYTDDNGVEANGYMWTDGAVMAKGYMWTDGGVSAKGYMWTDGVGAKSLLDGNDESGLYLNDD